jgi:hypothetical protein
MRKFGILGFSRQKNKTSSSGSYGKGLLTSLILSAILFVRTPQQESEPYVFYIMFPTPATMNRSLTSHHCSLIVSGSLSELTVNFCFNKITCFLQCRFYTCFINFEGKV